MSDPILSLRGVKTDIAQYHILHGVTFDVPRGGVTMLLGRNGAGKTTTLRTIMGLWKPHAGEILLDGAHLQGLNPAQIARRGIGFVPEDMGIFSDLTVEENIRLAALSGAPDPARLEGIFAAFPALKTFYHSRRAPCRAGRNRCCRSPVRWSRTASFISSTSRPRASPPPSSPRWRGR